MLLNFFGVIIESNLNWDLIERLLNSILLLNTTEESMREAGSIAASLDSQGIQINVGDLLIAAICKVNNYAIATNNTKHFERIEGLKLWPVERY